MRLWLPTIAVYASVLISSSLAEPAPDVFVPSFVDPAKVDDLPTLEPGTTIRFVTGSDYPPFDFTLPDGTLVGFNVDLARALCDVLKVACTIQARPWNDLLPALVGGEADAAIASLSITSQVRYNVAFTAPYYRTPARFVVRADASMADLSPADLNGKPVGVRAGTAQEAYLKSFFKGVKVRPFPTIDAARQALKVGEVEAVFDDGVGAAIWLNSEAAGACCAFRGGPYTESRFFGSGAGIAVRKNEGVLRRALDAALARLTASGRFGDLYLKYFPVGFY